MSRIRRTLRSIVLASALLLTGLAPVASQQGPDCQRQFDECLRKSLDWTMCYYEWVRCVTRQF